MAAVLIADEQALCRDGLRLLLQDLRPESQVLEADSLPAAREIVRAQRDFDLVFLSVTLPGGGPFGGLREMLKELPGAPIVLLTSTHDDGSIIQALDAGARGYLIRSSSREVARLAISLVLAGETYVPSDAIDGIRVQHNLGHMLGAVPRGQNPIRDLSGRQLEVLQLMLDGLPNKVIARRLGIRETTVKSHVKSIIQKLGVHNRTQAVLNALRYGCQPAKPLDS